MQRLDAYKLQVLPMPVATRKDSRHSDADSEDHSATSVCPAVYLQHRPPSVFAGSPNSSRCNLDDRQRHKVNIRRRSVCRSRLPRRGWRHRACAARRMGRAASIHSGRSASTPRAIWIAGTTGFVAAEVTTRITGTTKSHSKNSAVRAAPKPIVMRQSPVDEQIEHSSLARNQQHNTPIRTG